MSDEPSKVPEEGSEPQPVVLGENCSSSSPEPVPEGSQLLPALFAAATALTLGGAAFVLFGLAMAPTMGATRSARLRWQERDQEIERAWQQEQASPCDAPPRPDSTPDATHE